jgi:hypothetical protein
MSEEWVELSSGLRVPASAGVSQPSLLQQIGVRPAAADLGLPEWSLPELREVARRAPFEAAFVAVSRISARIWTFP